jgi:pyridoxal phosphate enzyme (YggS family)
MTIQTRIQQLQDQLQTVQLLAVSKGRSVNEILMAYDAGVTHFGENYYQEALVKIQQLQDYPLTWHFLGAIQQNKTKGIATQFDWVHSISQRRTAEALNQYRPMTLPPLNVCIQINIDHEESKTGINPHDSLALAQHIMTLPRLRLRGLMIIPNPNSSKPFQRTAALMQQLNQQLNHSLDTLSMGMTDSLPEAIEAGATIVRVGRGIFGELPHV